jgi:dolichyl-phosphate beta-glucosyltransferase
VSETLELSIVIPAYNEEKRIGSTVEAWLAYLSAGDVAGEIVVSDDGSSDRTREIVSEIRLRDTRVRLLDARPNTGKGGAVRDGVMAAQGRVVAYVDADLNISPAHMDPLRALLESGVADVVIGRRKLSEYASEESSVERVLAGAAVQVTRRVLLFATISDTQAGFKGFRRETARRIFGQATVDSFAFDLEVIFIARRLGARIVQMPVSVEYRPDSTYNVRKHLPPFLRDIVRIRWNALRRRYPTGSLRP